MSAPSTQPDTAPVTYDERHGLWRLHRHREVRAALLDPDRFAVTNALTAVTPITGPALRILARAGVTLPPALANNGTSTHPALRSIVSSYVTGARVRAAVPAMEAVAAEHVAAAEAEVGATGGTDLVRAIARDVPAKVLFHVLDLPSGQRPGLAALSRWGESSFELFWGRPDPDRQAALATSVAECHTWLVDTLRAARRNGPGDPPSLLDAMALAHDDHGRRLPLRLVASAAFFSVLAGQQTTGYLLACAFDRVLRTPGLAEHVVARPGAAREVVEDTLREQTPVTTWRRVTTCPVSVAGTSLPTGAQVLLMLADSGATADGTHLAFGAGGHRCPGASLARTEATTVLRATAGLLSSVRPAPGIREEVRLLSFRAPRRLPVTRR